MRRLLGNLDAEEDLAALPDPWAVPGTPPRRRQALTRPARERMAAAATLLRVFTREGDRLWTPAPPDGDLEALARRLAPLPGLPVPILEGGPIHLLPAMADVLAWAETPGAVLATGKVPGTTDQSPGTSCEVPGTTSLHDLLWHLPRAAPDVVARVHHRFFALDVAEGLGFALPGARPIATVEDLARHLALGHGTAGWVVKAPLSAAGRSRHIEPGGTSFTVAARQRVGRLLARHGPLLFEPWMARTADFGVSLLLLPGETRLVGFHRLLVDDLGRFQGIELVAGSPGIDLPAPERDRMERAIAGVAAALRAAGYVGPFGLDAWRYRLPDGSAAFHPLGEINARMTFGLVARALVDRLDCFDPGARVRLLFGLQLPPGSIPLLLPGIGGAAWLEG